MWTTGTIMAPTAPPLLHPFIHAIKGRGKRGGSLLTKLGWPICTKSPPGALSPHRERPRPHSRNRHVAPARPRSPPVRAAPAESSRIHWGLTRPYNAHTELGKRCGPPAKRSYPPQLCRQFSLATNSSPQSLSGAGTGHAARSIPAPAAAQG